MKEKLKGIEIHLISNDSAVNDKHLQAAKEHCLVNDGYSIDYSSYPSSKSFNLRSSSNEVVNINLDGWGDESNLDGESSSCVKRKKIRGEEVSFNSGSLSVESSDPVARVCGALDIMSQNPSLTLDIDTMLKNVKSKEEGEKIIGDLNKGINSVLFATKSDNDGNFNQDIFKGNKDPKALDSLLKSTTEFAEKLNNKFATSATTPFLDRSREGKSSGAGLSPALRSMTCNNCLINSILDGMSNDSLSVTDRDAMSDKIRRELFCENSKIGKRSFIVNDQKIVDRIIELSFARLGERGLLHSNLAREDKYYEGIVDVTFLYKENNGSKGEKKV